MHEELEKRLQERADRQTLAWWDQKWQEAMKGYRGVAHAVNLCHAEYESAGELIRKLTERVSSLEAELKDNQAAVGALRAELEQKLDKIREVYQELKNGGHDG